MTTLILRRSDQEAQMTQRPPIRLLHTEAEYDAAVAEYETWFDDEPQPGTPDGDRFELLGLVIARYEEGRFPTPQAHPLDVLRFAMDQQGRSQADLAQLLGSRSRASEILSGRRDLTLPQIRLMAKAWRIPAALLVGELAAA
jgi:HTH-type transcriptional regulator/antitoxin HigA